VSGYSGGHVYKPTYETGCTKQNSPVEKGQISRVPEGTFLLKIFFKFPEASFFFFFLFFFKKFFFFFFFFIWRFFFFKVHAPHPYLQMEPPSSPPRRSPDLDY
ncbi:hypothetical protein D9743_13330, partial [Staphylococcus aureus]